MQELKAKKSLGQHFLRSEKAIRQIVESINIVSREESLETVVFEIGPGEGVLTSKLLENSFVVVAIEIDKRSIELLETKFKNEIENKKLFIIEKNCLEIDYGVELKKISKNKEYILVGNIPYYITGAIFRNTFEQILLPKQAIFLVQKEVAQRVIAHDKKESILSVSVKIFTNRKEDVKIVDVVKAGSFSPAPKVDSAILNIENIINPFKTTEQEVFFKILRAAFSHKRKYLLSNFKTDLGKDIYEKYFENFKDLFTEKNRAENISLETWKKLINFI